MQYRNLENMDAAVIAETFQHAFADYAVPMTMTTEQLTTLMQTRSYAAAVSVGAFDGATLAGFVLNGLRTINGTLTAYDMGTGLLPAYRGKGISSAMVAHTLTLLKEHFVKAYVLEVLQDNAPAIALYKKQGFVETRAFLCYRAPKTAIPNIEKHNWQVNILQSFTPEDWANAEQLWDVTPSWQNAPASVQALPSHYAFAVVRDHNTAKNNILGYGILHKQNGTLMQLCVAQNARRNGIGTAILSQLASVCSAQEIRIVNVDDTCKPAVHFLEALSFSVFAKQWEMQKEL